MGSEVTSSPRIKPAMAASESRRMPKDLRDAIPEKAATIANELYRSDPSLTDFEAFEAEEIQVDCGMP